MNYEEAMKAARRGHKVAPRNRDFFVYYVEETTDFGCYRRVSIGNIGQCWDEDFHPTVYEKMMTWELYQKDPLRKLKEFIQRVSKRLQLNQLSSNPS